MKHYIEGWGVPFQYVRSDYAEAMYEMEGRAKEEKWDEIRYEEEIDRIEAKGLSRRENKRVFRGETPAYTRMMQRRVTLL